MTFNITPEERELVLARMEVLSPDLVFSSGSSSREFTRDEMIKHVEQGDEIGNEFVKIDMEFMRALKSGELMRELTGNRL